MRAAMAANLAVIEELFGALVAFLAPLDDEALNWAPLPADANTIAALVSHTVGALDNWLARAVEEPVRRDRDAEFHVRASATELIATIERARITARRRLDLLDDVDPATVRSVVRLSTRESVSVSIAWCVEHAVIHTGEHWGQIQLTRQLYEKENASGGTSALPRSS